MYRLVRPLLFLLPPEAAHHLALMSLKYFHLKSRVIEKDSVNLMGISFPNRIGLAAGLDKNGEYIDALASLGFGFIEVGTVTPRPQAGNPKPRLFRLAKAKALINRMGFNNKGVDYLVEQIKKSKYQGILGINIGKNSVTPNDKAIEDYLVCLKKVYDHASYIVINISSPNTPDLRELQHGDYLNALLSSLKKEQTKLADIHGKYIPLMVKLAPDLTAKEIKDTAHYLTKHHVDGVVATNTSFSRKGVESLPNAREKGGLSGSPIFEQSNQVIAILRDTLGEKFPIIGLGGITNVTDVKAKLSAGANLIQVYTGLIYQGPAMVKKLIAS